MDRPLADFRLYRENAVYHCELWPCEDGGVRLLMYRDEYLDYTGRFPTVDHAREFAHGYHAQRAEMKRALMSL